MLKMWKVLKRTLLLDALPWFKVFKEKVELPDGRIIDNYYTIDRPDYVEIIAMNRNHQVIGLWQYKHGVGKIHLGLPAGYIKKGEIPLMAAERELKEEVGLISANWENLGEFVLEGNRSPSKVYIFAAYDCVNCKPITSDDLEETKSEWLSLEKWVQYIRTGHVAVIGAATAILIAIMKLRDRIKDISI